jgi:hypothetical protein
MSNWISFLALAGTSTHGLAVSIEGIRNASAISVVRLSPDWGQYDLPTAVAIDINFTTPDGYRIINSTMEVVGPTGVNTTLHGSVHSAANITFTIPALNVLGRHCFTLAVNVGTFASSNRFDVSDRASVCFTSAPRFGSITNVGVQNGPPSGGTMIDFDFDMDQRGSGFELACVFADARVPVTYTVPADPSLPLLGSCVTPIAEAEKYLCVQLVPKDTASTLYATVQSDPLGQSCDATDSFYFNFFSQMPIITAIYPPSGISDGGSQVTVAGINFPSDRESRGGDLACIFGSSIVAAQRLNSSAVLCWGSPTAASTSVAPDPVTNRTTVPLSISFNSGKNFVPVPSTFIYVPTIAISRIVPENGVVTGGTVVDLSLEFKNPAGSPLFGPRGVCVDNSVVAASWISDDFTRLSFEAPAAGANGQVQISILQEDGRCGQFTVTFAYHPAWSGTGVTLSVLTGGETMVMNVTGSDFFPSQESACMATAIFPSASRLPTACNVSGTFSYLNSSLGTCAIDLGSSFYECGYVDASPLMGTEKPSQEILWESMSVKLAIAMNGRDFVTVTESENGLELPATMRAVRLPIIRSLDPNVGFDYGGYIIEVKLETGVAWDVTKCLFTSVRYPSRRVEVRATPYAIRSVACMAPRWLGNDEVSIQLQVNENELLTAPASFDFVQTPEITGLTPREGAVAGGTELTLTGVGFDDPLVAELIAPAVQCVFGQSVATPGRLVNTLSPPEIRCITPSLPTTGPRTLDIALSWQTAKSNRVSKLSIFQSVFNFKAAEIRLASVSPLMGPVVGLTDVVVTTLDPVYNTGVLRCVFGGTIAVGEWTNSHQFVCKSPPVSSPGIGSFFVSIDAQTPLISTPTNTLTFEYYRPPSVAVALPDFGTSIGGTVVLIEGSYFRNSSDLVCRFGEISVPVLRYISSQQVVCVSPGGPLGPIALSVSNNNKDFNSVLQSGFTYVESQPLLIMTPILGPVTGGTVIRIRPAIGSLPDEIMESSVLAGGPRCSFGSLSVGAVFTSLTTGEVECVSPAVTGPGLKTVAINYDGQEIAYASQQFRFHPVNTISSIDPPMSPIGVPSTVTIYGSSFVNSQTLTVRFGAPSVGYTDVQGLFISETEIRCNPPAVSPAESVLRVPVMVSNNGQDFVPSTINNWDPDDDSFQASGVAQYYIFHFPIILHSVFPAYGNVLGGGFVSVHGGPFLISETLACGFNRIVSSVKPIFISSTHILCPLPNMWATGAAMTETAQLQLALVPNRWSESFLNFTFLTTGATPGQYTPHLTATEWTAQPVPCDPGFMCESPGMASPIPCPAGAFQPYPGQLQCLPCPVGFYCPHARLTEPVMCPGGWVCDQESLVVPWKRCPSGYICLAGTGSLDPIPDEPFNAVAPNAMSNGYNAAYRCLKGKYCMEGTAALVSMLGNFSTPQPCFQGYYCPPGSRTPLGAGGIPIGKYSPVPINPGILCPPRYFCGPVTGNLEPTACVRGTFNSRYGQHNCTLAFEGYVAPSPLLAQPIPADCGYVAGRKGISILEDADKCPAAAVCDFGTASAAEPKICVELPYEDPSLCDSTVGQVYYEAQGISSSDRLNPAAAHCCWNSTVVVNLARRVENIFTSMPSGGAGLETLAARRFRQTLQSRTDALVLASPLSHGFDGKMLLDLVNKQSLTSEFGVHIGKVRDRILFEIERHFTLKSPDPCPPGVFCNRGTCAGFAAVVNTAKER